MANKEIKIRAVLDSQGFDNEVNKLQQKLKQMQQQQEGLGKAQGQLGGDTMMGKYAQKAFGDFSKDSKKDLEAMFQSQKREAVQQKISIKEKEQALKSLGQIEGNLTRQQQQRVKLLEKELSLLQERNRTTIQGAAQTKQVLGQMEDGAQEAGAGNTGGPAGGAGGNFKSGMMSMLKGIGIAGIVKGALNAVVTGAQHVVSRDRNILTQRGATADMASREMREDFGGKGSKGMFFAGQRRNAMMMAAREQKSEGALDYLKTGAAVVGGGLLAAGGAAAIATGVGAPIGMGMLAGAGAVGATAGFGGAMSSDKLRSRVFDQEQYQSMMTKEGMQKYEANLAAQKALDPSRTMAQEEFQSNAGRYRKMQRSMGFTGDDQLLGKSSGKLSAEGQASPYAQPNGFMDAMDAVSNVPQMGKAWGRSGRGQAQFDTGLDGLARGFTDGQSGVLARGMGSDDVMNGLLGIKPAAERQSEGYLIDQQKAGTGEYQFSQENILGQRADILQGGGATSAQNLAGRAATYERNLNMENAGSVFGKIAGAGMGITETSSEDATKRLLAEGVKLGVNTSTMPQEMKRFTEAAASIMTQGGGLSDTAVSRFAGGLGGTSGLEIQAGQGAYDEALKDSKSAGGMEGQIGMGYLMGKDADKILGKDENGKQRKLSSEMLNSVNQLSAEDLERDPALLKGTAKRLGVSEEKLQELVSGKDAAKQSRTKGLEDLQNEYNKNTKGMTAKEKDEYDMSDDGSQLYSKLQTRRAQEKGGFMQKTSAERKAAVRMRSSFQNTDGMNIDGELAKVEADLATEPDTGANAEEKAQATGEGTKTKAVREQMDDLKKAAKAHTEAAELYNEQFKLFTKAAGTAGAKLDDMTGKLDDVVDRLSQMESGLAAAEPE